MEKYFNDEFDDCKSKHRYMKRQRIREEGGCEDTLVSTSSKLGQLSRDDVPQSPTLPPLPSPLPLKGGSGMAQVLTTTRNRPLTNKRIKKNHIDWLIHNKFPSEKVIPIGRLKTGSHCA